MTVPTCPSHAGHRFPAEIISDALWPYFRFPLSLRYVDEILARGVAVSPETVRQWGLKFGQAFANQVRRWLPRAGDKAASGRSASLDGLSSRLRPSPCRLKLVSHHPRAV